MNEKAYSYEELKQALSDVCDGQCAEDLRYFTGLPMERCREIITLASKVISDLNSRGVVI